MDNRAGPATRENIVKKRSLPLVVAVALHAPLSLAQVHVVADGQTDAYTLIDRSLISPGSTARAIETPDCLHPDFGPHITQVFDVDLAKPVFVFHLHRDIDGDGSANGGCQRIDRQRLEIKTFGPSPDSVKAFLGDTVSYRWRFKLDADFQVSTSFTHIHQIKAGDGTNADSPIITLTPVRLSSGSEVMEIRYDGSGAGVFTRFQRLPLAPFKGAWLEARETVIFTEPGAFSMEIRRVGDGAVLLSDSHVDIPTWRSGGTTFVRPKWGLYRSLNQIASLRDEQVRFDGFCLAKGTEECPRLAAAPWQAGVAYQVGDLATNESDTWKCIQPHRSQSDWVPPQVPALWVKVPRTQEWTQPVQYPLGAEVTYQGATYSCRQPHTSLPGWTPPATPALWLPK